MSQLLEGQNVAQGQHLVDLFHEMLTDLDSESSEFKQLLGDAVIFYNVRNFPNRIKCALLSWMGAKTLLDGKPDD
jgi:nitrogen fixation NifU-like protein